MRLGGATTRGQSAAGTPPVAAGQNGSGDDHASTSRRTQIIVALIGAGATIIAGVLAINSGAVHVSVTDPAEQTDSVRATATSLEEENRALAAENDQLQERLDAVPPQDTLDTDDGPVVTSGPEQSTSSVRRQTGDVPLTFSWGYSVDLDSNDGPAWKVSQGSDTGWDLYLDGDGDVTTHEVTIVDHVPTEAECRDATVRQPGLRDEQSTLGTMLCVLTSEDRYAFVRIAAIDEERRTTSVDVVVWE